MSTQNPKLTKEQRRELVERLHKSPDGALRVSRWTRLQARDEARQQGVYGQLLESRSAGAWPTFVRELFASLFAIDVGTPDEPAKGAEWIASVLKQAAELPDWKRLARRARSSSWAAAMATHQVTVALKPVLDEVLKDAPAEDPVEQLGEEGGDAAAGTWAEKALAASVFTAAVKRAVSAAVEHVVHELDEVVDVMEGLTPGTGSVSGPRSSDGVEKLYELIKRDPHLRDVARLAGRMKVSMRAVRKRNKVPGSEEMYAVEFGADVSRILPQELGLLGDADTEVLFDAKLVERRVAQYELRGPEYLDRGPVVVLLDESGSMEGPRQQWACAVALALIELAQRTRRGWCVAHYQGSITRSLVKPPGKTAPLSELIAAVAAHTGGGTDIGIALDWAGKTLPLGKKADVIVVSDGGDSDFADSIERLQAQGARVFGIAVQAQFPEPERGRFDQVVQIDRLDVAPEAVFAL